jgi:hypothetical protein
MINFLFCCHKANLTLPVVNVFPVSSVFRKFYRTDSSPPQAPEKPSALKGASKETQPTIKTGTVNTEDLLQLSVVVDYPRYLM